VNSPLPTGCVLVNPSTVTCSNLTGFQLNPRSTTTVELQLTPTTPGPVTITANSSFGQPGFSTDTDPTNNTRTISVLSQPVSGYVTGDIIVSGAGNRATGKLIAGGAVRVSGAGHQLTGGVTYGTQFSNIGAGNTINPTPIKAGSVSAVPFDFAAWLPSGPIAKTVGASYTNASTNCVGTGATRTWTPPATLTPGVYYADCRINITGAGRTYNATFVSTQDVIITGAGIKVTTFVANASVIGKTGVTINGANVATIGQIQSVGPVLLSGATGVHRGGVLANTLTLSGAGTRLEP
jgi:hypothetical protein